MFIDLKTLLGLDFGALALLTLADSKKREIFAKKRLWSKRQSQRLQNDESAKVSQSQPKPNQPSSSAKIFDHLGQARARLEPANSLDQNKLDQNKLDQNSLDQNKLYQNPSEQNYAARAS